MYGSNRVCEVSQGCGLEEMLKRRADWSVLNSGRSCHNTSSTTTGTVLLGS